ncbi:hypothetical protein D3C87_626370 [compost metagenome]|uniref:hypothetical protein n=1 Tax=Agrobacterium radiobacter TaxID=362 RepID=UPI000FC3C58A
MAVLKGGFRGSKNEPWVIAKRAADLALREEAALARQSKANAFAVDFSPFDIHWGDVKPQPLPEPVKRTRKRAA